MESGSSVSADEFADHVEGAGLGCLAVADGSGAVVAAVAPHSGLLLDHRSGLGSRGKRDGRRVLPPPGDRTAILVSTDAIGH